MNEDDLRLGAIAARIVGLTHRKQIAFAAGCAEQSLQMMRYDYYPEGAATWPLYHFTVEALWCVAAGATLATPLLSRWLDNVWPTDNPANNWGFPVPANTRLSIRKALDAVDDPSGEAARQAGWRMAVAFSGFTCLGEHMTYDYRYQEVALTILEAWPSDYLPRRLFADLAPLMDVVAGSYLPW